MTLNINPVNWFEIRIVYEKDLARTRASCGAAKYTQPWRQPRELGEFGLSPSGATVVRNTALPPLQLKCTVRLPQGSCPGLSSLAAPRLPSYSSGYGRKSEWTPLNEITNSIDKLHFSCEQLPIESRIKMNRRRNAIQVVTSI